MDRGVNPYREGSHSLGGREIFPNCRGRNPHEVCIEVCSEVCLEVCLEVDTLLRKVRKLQLEETILRFE